MERTNIFRFAKKELSQDAVICSILAEEDDRSIAFLQAMIKNHPICSECSIALPATFTIVHDSLKQQDGNIDIFLEISSGSARYAVIIEDKTDTSMHDQQMTQYIYQKMSKKGRKYDGCFFILFKTGKTPFWEIDGYRDEIRSIQNGILESWQYVKPKDKAKIANQLCFLRDYTDRIRFSYFGRRDFIDLLHQHSWEDYLWMSDYLAYISDDSCFQQDNIFPWMERYTGTKEQFAAVLSNDLWKRISIYMPKGRGKRYYDCAFEGICGSKARSLVPSSTIREAYYFLPVVTFEGTKATVKLNFHAFQNENDRQGYQSFIKYSDEIIKKAYKSARESVFNELRRLLDSRLWTFAKSIRENTLLLCECEVGYSADIFQNYGSLRQSELQERVYELLNAVFEIRKKLFDE